jgi:uncharacterized protein YdhG (YjbR/CyaY superfamily)
MDDALQTYLDGIPDAHRPLFDRIEALVRGTFPDAELLLSYRMPTFRVGDSRLYVGVWKHGVSLYGWREDGDGGFVARHPTLTSGKGTIRLTPAAAATIDDDDLGSLVVAALGGIAA